MVIVTLDLGLFQLSWGRGSQGQNEQEGQDHQVKFVHCCARGVGVVGGRVWMRTVRDYEGRSCRAGFCPSYGR